MDEMAEVYQSSDISVIPTKAAEGLSLSLLESMSCGLPVITTPVGGIGDAVIDRYNALVYDPNHDNLGEYIDYMAKHPDLMELFGKRNREIAVQCFDIEIWKNRWRKLLQQFDKTPKLGGIKKEPLEPKKKPKLTAMMVVKNESDRYLRRVIENTLLFADNIMILDDHSEPEQYDKMIDLLWDISEDSNLEPGKVFFKQAENSWDNEVLLRAELLELALTTNPDWLIAIDADELYEVGMAEEVQRIMSQNKADWAGFRFYDFWNDDEHYRDDDMFPAGYGYAPRMFRVGAFNEYLWPDRKRHCGSIPENLLQKQGLNSAVRVKHLGYVKPEDRDKKYLEKVTDDLKNEFYPEDVYNAILHENPPAVKWDDSNPWQAGAGKKTIAYPPGMHWGMMQQRPHHLLKLASSERNRVFFGDDMAPGEMEVAPYLTLVRDWQNCPYVKDVDVLYVTHPHQMEYCKDMKYKTLIYDCVDWVDGKDFELICKADLVLFASKLLYDKIPSLIMHTGQTGTCSIEYYKWFNDQKMIYVPNACDFDLFSKTADPVDDVVGYMGIVNSILNPDIINALSKKWPCLVMGEKKDIVKNTNRNINITGHVPYQKLPSMLQQCKVGIIPFRTDNDYIRYSAPIKAYDYLAAGRPVVATRIPELQPLADMGLIRLVDDTDYEGWVEAVGQAMTEYPNEAGREWAKEQTWKARYEQIKVAIGL